MIEQVLRRIGLTDGEIRVYVALLELGSTTTWNLTKKSGISGSKVYEVLDRLAKKGLVSNVIKNNVKYFECADPERILDFLEDKNEEIETEKNEVRKIIPDLILKKARSVKAEVKVYTGFEGAKTVYAETVRDCKKGDEMLQWGLTEQPAEWERYLNEKEKMRGDKGIIHKTIINRRYQSLYNVRKRYKNTFIKFFPENFEMPTAVLLWKNKVSLYVITKENPITIVIDSEAVANSFRKSFQILWKNAKD